VVQLQWWNAKWPYLSCLKPASGRDLYNGGVNSIGDLGKYFIIGDNFSDCGGTDGGQDEEDDWQNGVSVHCEER